MATHNQGEVSITLGGEPVALRCTLAAAKKITASFGSYMKAAEGIDTASHDAFVAIVAAGLGKERKDVEAAVFAAGMHNLAKPLSEYVLLLSRGGEPMPTDGAAEDAPKGEG